jgi:ABC-2 type transport system ATP-binding protein
MSQPTIIQTKDLTRVYGKFTAVDKLNLNIDEGEIFGFLGPNGAGKTTTILMLLGLTEPTSGTVSINGLNPTREPLKIKRIVGYLPEKVGFYEDLTIRENLTYTARLNCILRKDLDVKIDKVVRDVGLSEYLEHKVGKLSHGMKQRLGIADVMIKNPRVVFFDEPTSGIDPQGVDEIIKLINQMKKAGITAIISSHQLHHIQAVCSRVGIMAKGKLIAEGPIDLLGKTKMGEGKFQIEVQASPVNEKLLSSIEKMKGVHSVQRMDEIILVTCDQDIRSDIARAVLDSECMLSGLKIEEYDLQDIYMKYFSEQ